MSLKKTFFIFMIVLVCFGLWIFLAFTANLSRSEDNSEFNMVLREAEWALETTKVMLEEYIINPGPRPFKQLKVKFADYKTDKNFERLSQWSSKFRLIEPLLDKQDDFLFIVELLIDQSNTGSYDSLLYKETAAQAFLISYEMTSFMSDLSESTHEQIMNDFWTFISTLIIGLIVLSIGVFLLVLWMRKQVLGRVLVLEEAACRIAEGDYSREVHVFGVDELSRLAQSFYIMQHSVQNHLKALAQEKEQLSTILHSIGDAVIAVNREASITLMNPVAEQLTGWTFEESQGLHLNEIFNILKENSRTQQESPVPNVLETGEIKQLANHTLLISKTGDEYQIADSAAPIRVLGGSVEGVVLVFRDVSEQKRMQDLMIQSEKMLSVGGLAAGMAHEINNPLSGMMQTASVIHERLSTELPANMEAAKDAEISLEALKNYMEGRGIYRMLESLKNSGSRIGKIVNNMLSFARKGPNQVSEHALDQLVDYALELAATDYNMKKNYDFRNIHIVRDYATNLPLIPCDEGQIEQVVLNLLRNGAQAFWDSGTSHPCFTIRIYVESNQKFVCLEVEDNGPGIEESILSRIFEPFFTTKPVGEGTGLGLSVSYFIVSENHQGEMVAINNPGEGATFIVRLPFL